MLESYSLVGSIRVLLSQEPIVLNVVHDLQIKYHEECVEHLEYYPIPSTEVIDGKNDDEVDNLELDDLVIKGPCRCILIQSD